jgi:hypothetical protein
MALFFFIEKAKNALADAKPGNAKPQLRGGES